MDSLPSSSRVAPSLTARLGIAAVVGLVSGGLLIVTGVLAWAVGGTLPQLLFLVAQVVFISVLIWQACDPFAAAAQWIGIRWKLPGSVRGATLDAIASSMPELFCGCFFVILAISTAVDAETAREHIGCEGYGPTVATCAGSAIYNMVLIPAACALVISYRRRSRPTIDIAQDVVLRDGMWFLACEALFIFFLFQDELPWWTAVVFLGLYAAYILRLALDARMFRRALTLLNRMDEQQTRDLSVDSLGLLLREHGMRPTTGLLESVWKRFSERGQTEVGNQTEEEEWGTAEYLFGHKSVRLTALSAWTVISVCTVVAAVACYWLVEVTRTAAELLQVPLFFIAVVLVAAASSVPDTFLSVGAALRGDDDGAVSNAFGSNIFDICVCLSIPLLVSCYLSGWQPVSLTQNGSPLPGLVGIRVLLCLLSVATLLMMWHKLQITRTKAWVMCGLYGAFVMYAINGSLREAQSSMLP